MSDGVHDRGGRVPEFRGLSNRMLLITGHQRSGTGYMAKLCQACGLDVGHERPGRDGISSFQYAVATDRVPFHSVDGNRGRNHYRFDRIIHVVRHPLGVIASTAWTAGMIATEWQAQFVPVDLTDSRIRQATQTYLGWNELVEQQTSERIRVEDALAQLPGLLGVQAPKCPPPMDYNARPHDPLTWDRVACSCSDDEYRRLLEMAERYEYRTPMSGSIAG